MYTHFRYMVPHGCTHLRYLVHGKLYSLEIPGTQMYSLKIPGTRYADVLTMEVSTLETLAGDLK
jgi:hypothetical protein